MPNNLPHLRIDNFANPRAYRYPRKLRVDFEIAQRNRAIHGNELLRKATAIRNQFQINDNEQLPAGIVRDDVVYVEFISYLLNSIVLIRSRQILNFKS